MLSSPLHKKVALIVAHPDDETLWAGGILLQHPEWHCFIISLCRASDHDRASRFRNALKVLKANGNMHDLDDGPEQIPLSDLLVQKTILQLLPQRFAISAFRAPVVPCKLFSKLSQLSHFALAQTLIR
jgi:hypothetical protein